MIAPHIPYNGHRLVGIDEVGRGPIAGPVVAAAVILNKHVEGLTDSKKLSEKKRQQLAEQIKQNAVCYGIGRVEREEIDAINILQASLLAMQRAVENLELPPEYAVVDGNIAPKLNMPCQTIIKGDLLIPVISAASILAKVERDAEMIHLDQEYPGYGLAQHKGYPTKQHIQALNELGLTPLHRRTFGPVKRLLL